MKTTLLRDTDCVRFYELPTSMIFGKRVFAQAANLLTILCVRVCVSPFFGFPCFVAAKGDYTVCFWVARGQVRFRLPLSGGLKDVIHFGL